MRVVNQNPANISGFRRGYSVPRVRKDPLGPEEKAHMIARLKAGPAQRLAAWGWEFRRLPATILKFAAEAGVKVLP